MFNAIPAIDTFTTQSDSDSTRDGAVTVTGWCQLRVASSFLL